MDALSALIATLAPRGRMDLHCLFGQRFAAPHEQAGLWRAPFHIALRGSCELWLARSGELVQLEEGSIAILPRGAEHVLRAGTTGQRSRKIRQLPGGLVDVKTNLAPQAEASIEILCGEFEFTGRRRSALLEALPEVFVVRLANGSDAAGLESLIRLMAQEIAQMHPGSAAIVAQLSSTLFTLALREHLATQPAPAAKAGVLGMMRSPRLSAALQAMLERPEEPWTLASLAALCHLSRASYAREFERYVGEPPLALLTTLRMERAALLLQGTQDTASIGEAVGYRSEAAFNRAFTRYAGVTPGRFRRSQSGAAADSETAPR